LFIFRSASLIFAPVDMYMNTRGVICLF